MRSRLAACAVCAAALILGGCSSPAAPPPAPTEPAALVARPYRADIVAHYPHDPAAEVHGLTWVNGALWEAVSVDGGDELRSFDRETARPAQRQRLPEDVFADAISPGRAARQVILLTTLGPKAAGLLADEDLRVAYRWNLRTHTGTPFGSTDARWDGAAVDSQGFLVASNASNVLTWLSPRTFTVVRTRSVVDDAGKPVTGLGELEWVNGMVAARIIGQPDVVFIDPFTGQVRYRLDTRGIQEAARARTPMSAIAFNPADPKGPMLYVVGTGWREIIGVRAPDGLRAVRPDVPDDVGE